MKKEMLESYQSKKTEITELKKEIENLWKSENMIGNDTILDYRTGVPIPRSVVGFDFEKFKKKYEKKSKLMEGLEKECEDIENYIDSIPESETRRIFKMYYIDGLTMQKIGKKMHMDKSTVSRKISETLAE